MTIVIEYHQNLIEGEKALIRRLKAELKRGAIDPYTAAEVSQRIYSAEARIQHYRHIIKAAQ